MTRSFYKLFTSMLFVMVIAFVLMLLSVGMIAQTQSNACGGTYCIQPRVGIEQLDNQTATLLVAGNGSRWVFGQNSEDLTLSTSATTTDTAANLLPANAFILGVSGTVTTTITTGCTGWQLGDPTTAGRFTASDTTLTQGESKVGSVMATTGVASATTGVWQSAAAKIRVTCATAAAGAGKVRLTVFYWQIIPPSI